MFLIILLLKSLDAHPLFIFILLIVENLNPCVLKCIFVGYSSTQKGYKCYHPPTKNVLILADVTFVEDTSYFDHPYLYGEIAFLENKNRDLFLLDFSFSLTPSPPPLVSNSKDL